MAMKSIIISKQGKVSFLHVAVNLLDLTVMRLRLEFDQVYSTVGILYKIFKALL